MYFIAAKRCKTAYFVLLFCHQNKNFVIWHHLNSIIFLQSLWSGSEDPGSQVQQDKLPLTPVNRESCSGFRLRLGAGFSLHHLQAGLVGLRWFKGHAVVQVLSSFVTVISARWLQQIEIFEKDNSEALGIIYILGQKWYDAPLHTFIGQISPLTCRCDDAQGVNRCSTFPCVFDLIDHVRKTFLKKNILFKNYNMTVFLKYLTRNRNMLFYWSL